MEQHIFEKLAEHGVLGVLVFALGAWVVVLHRELRDERRERLGDVKKDSEVASKMQLAGAKHAETLDEALQDLKDRKAEIERERAAERERDVRRTR